MRFPALVAASIVGALWLAVACAPQPAAPAAKPAVEAPKPAAEQPKPATQAQPAAAKTLKIGVVAGISGYLANIDRGWRDGVALAIEVVNAAGGAAGHRLEAVVEDNRSEPQETVTAVNKLITADKVQILLNGCSSAGNAAAAPLAVRHKVPMILCSILPPEDRVEERRWSFSTLPLPQFEVLPRLEYLSKRTQIRKIGVLFDPTPYAGLQRRIAEAEAPKHGLTIVGIEQYKADDADLSAQINKLRAAGAEAILKMGAGPTTVTAAKNVKQLGLQIPLLTSIEDLAVFRQAADALGEQLFFVANPPQIYEALPGGTPTKQAIDDLLKVWQAKYRDRDPTWGGRGWDAVNLTVAALKKAGAADGAALRDALDTIDGFPGTSGIYRFEAQNHFGISKENPIVLAQIVGGRVRIVQ